MSILDVFKYRELEVGESRKVVASKHMLERLLSKSVESLPEMVSVANAFTGLTGREMEIDMYSCVRSTDSGSLDLGVDLVFAPQIGTANHVMMPDFDQEHQKQVHEGKIFVPVFYLHTHPGNTAVPSARDLKTDFGCSEQVLHSNGSMVKFRGKPIGAVSCPGRLFFYQYTGDFKEYLGFLEGYGEMVRKFVRDKEELFAKCKEVEDFEAAKERLEKMYEDFAQSVKIAGVFNTMYHNYSKAKRGPTNFPLGRGIVTKFLNRFSFEGDLVRAA